MMKNQSKNNNNVKKPRNIWEIDEHYLCPVIGFCLTLAELEVLLRKCTKGTDAASKKLTGINLHEFFVMGISKDTPIARKVQRFLEVKYAKEMLQYKNIPYREWLVLADSLCNPDYYGAYIWISATCFAGSKEEQAQVYGKIHLYSHKMLVHLHKNKMCLTELRQQNTVLLDVHSDLKQQLKWAQKEIVRLNGECARLKTEASRYLDDKAYVHTYAVELNLLRKSKASLEQLITEQVDENRALRKENDSLRRQLGRAEESILPLKEDIAELIRSLQLQQACCEDCERVSLCSKRVLIVGGFSRMVSFYREIVEKLEGRFDFHDGRCHNGNDHLRRQILQSDLVICPVDINSHAACLEVKRVCKRSNKVFYMLRKSSVSTVFSTLVTAANSTCTAHTQWKEQV
ncbi:MAG: DUF2325 domain-containing protein [Chitinispirillaceae bacterium]